ncbi:MAG: methyltransferase domain-containing protein [Geobacter sp.]|nr:methyltransferase domain-containing protein [Geobacter sp.]
MTAKLKEEAAKLRQLWGGYWSARVVITANNFRVFDYMQKPVTAEEIAGRLRADVRGMEILLDALAGLGLARKAEGMYRNSSISSRFLVFGGKYYQGNILRHADILWQNWSRLDEVVRTGKPMGEAHDHGAFIRGMHNLAILKARDVVMKVGLKGLKSALDLGGGPGTYSMEMAREGVAATLFDMPETITIAREIVRESGVKGIDFLAGDFTVDPIGGGYDLVLVSQVLHAYGEADNLALLKKVRAALNPGGRVVIQEFAIDASRTKPPQAALFSVNMLVNTPGGRCYAPEEIKGWLKEAGFRGVKAERFEEAVLVSGVINQTPSHKLP